MLAAAVGLRLGVTSHPGFFAAAGVACLAGVQLWRAGAGRMVFLFLSAFSWLLLLSWGVKILALATHPVPSLAVAALLALLLPILAVRWALRWPPRLTPPIESLHVYTGPAFARGHRFGKLSWREAGVALWIAVSAVAVGVSWPAFGIGAATFMGLTVGMMMTKGAIASPMVYLSLLASFPLSIPLLFYWADGVRPNLIYRHRFERLMGPRVGSIADPMGGG